MTAIDLCPEVEQMWLGLCAMDKSEITMGEVLLGFTHHVVRHDCEVLDVQAVVIDLLLLMTEDPEVISSLALDVESVGDRCKVWRDFLLRALGNLVVFAPNRASAGAVAARRELYRLCRRWDLPADLAAWRG